MVFRASSTLLGLSLAFGFASGLACSTNTPVSLETYEDEAAEDYGCIVGDLGCACLAGDVCDGGLTCVDDICRCVEGPCKEMPPVTTSEESDSGTDSGSETATESTTDATDTESTEDTTDTESSTDTESTESTTETTTDTESDSSSDSGSDTGTT
jgi:hypothetical protein